VKWFIIILLGVTNAFCQGVEPKLLMLGRSPDRIINDKRVNLRPLIAWWTNVVELNGYIDRNDVQNDQDPKWTTRARLAESRPLPGWFRIKGRKVLDRGAGWVVAGDIESEPGKIVTTRIYLKHAPAEDERTVLAMQPERARLVAGRRQCAEWLAANHSEGEDLKEEEFVARLEMILQGRDRFYDPKVRLAEWKSAFNRRHQQCLKDLDARMERRLGIINAELANHPDVEGYEIDFFAFRNGEFRESLAVFDLGMRVR